MQAFRLFLATFLIALAVYTAITIANHGANLAPIFFGDIMKMGWPGQFNFDFLGFLMLSAIWTAWRNQFSPAGFGLSVLALTGGMMFLTIYLLILNVRTNGDIRAIMLGPDRARETSG